MNRGQSIEGMGVRMLTTLTLIKLSSSKSRESGFHALYHRTGKCVENAVIHYLLADQNSFINRFGLFRFAEMAIVRKEYLKYLDTTRK